MPSTALNSSNRFWLPVRHTWRGWSEATYFYLGIAYAQRRDWEHALPSLKKCIELCAGVRDPRGFPWQNARDEILWVEQQIIIDRAESLRHQHQYAEAIEIYLQVHDQYPGSCSAAYALMMVGMCYRQLSDRDLTFEYLQQAARECPDACNWEQATIAYFLGEDYAARKDEQQALQAWQKCLELCPGGRDSESSPWKEARQAILKLQQPPAPADTQAEPDLVQPPEP